MRSKAYPSVFRAPALMLLALTALATVTLPALAASSTPRTQTTQSTATPNAHSQTAPLKVSYYAGDPQKGGKLIRVVTLTLPPRPLRWGQTARTQAQTRPAPSSATGRPASRPNPIVNQAPAGATFAVIRDAQGQTRTIDLAHPGFGMRAPGSPANRMQPGGGTPTNR